MAAKRSRSPDLTSSLEQPSVSHTDGEDLYSTLYGRGGFMNGAFPSAQTSAAENHDLLQFDFDGLDGPLEQLDSLDPIDASTFKVAHFDSQASMIPSDSATPQSDVHSSTATLSAPASGNELFGTNGYTPDGSYLGQMTTSRIDDFLLNDQLVQALTLDGNDSSSLGLAPVDAGNKSQSNPTNYTQHTSSAQGANHPAGTLLQPDNYLMSPSLTSESSPASWMEVTQRPQQQQPITSSNSAAAFGLNNHTSIANRASPAVAPVEGLNTEEQLSPVQLKSPIVRVQDCGWGEQPSENALNRSGSRRSRGSQVSANLLSPYLHNRDDFSSSEESEEDKDSAAGSRPMTNIERHEDGSWAVDEASGQGGIGPEEREKIGDVSIPSLQEQEEKRLVAEKNAEVEDWLAKAGIDSRLGQERANRANGPPRTSRRRAKSATGPLGHQAKDWVGSQGQPSLVDDSSIPGPGLFLDEKSDDEESLNDDDSGTAIPGSPPAEVQVTPGELDAQQFVPLHGSYTVPERSGRAALWDDEHVGPGSPSDRYLPQTSNAAMMRFHMRARDLETVSRSATIGSRRLSESDVGSIFAANEVSNRLNDYLGKEGERDKDERRGSFLDSILPRRRNSNLLKRKGNEPSKLRDSETGQNPVAESHNRLGSVIRRASRSRGRTAKTDITMPTDGNNVTNGSAMSPSTTSGAWAQAKNVIKRTRSRSDVNASLKGLLSQHGGPPVLTVLPQVGDDGNRKVPAQLNTKQEDGDEENADEEMEAPGVVMDLKVRSDLIIPTPEGFKDHARQLNPRLDPYMVERIAQEQVRRFQRLMELKGKHVQRVRTGHCPSGTFCFLLGGEAKLIHSRTGSRDSDGAVVGFAIVPPGTPAEDNEGAGEGPVIAAQFPPGVPYPPVKRLPAEFECPLCFKVKRYLKPSDWSKHIHEDVQPFTCSFPNCGEPKSFKRKADWVRHENERHRQLEKWTCTVGECKHVCFRKDNFVQHLVREHKIPEPKARTGKSAANSPLDTHGQLNSLREWKWSIQPGYPTSTASSDEVWAFVENCRSDTTKQPKDEPCRFCGNICTTWKKLTAHLAKHMEQIAMPVLNLVEQSNVKPESFVNAVVDHPLSNPSPSVSDLPGSVEGDLSPHMSEPAPYSINWNATMGTTQNQPHFSTAMVPSQISSTFLQSREVNSVPRSVQMGPEAYFNGAQPPYGVQPLPGSKYAAHQPNSSAGKASTLGGPVTAALPAGYQIATPNDPYSLGAANSPYTRQQLFQSPVDALLPNYDYTSSEFQQMIPSTFPTGMDGAHTNPVAEHATMTKQSRPRHPQSSPASFLQQQNQSY